MTRAASLGNHPLPRNAVLTPAAAAHRLGVAVPTLRSWARRHGLGPSVHEPGRHRRYTLNDLRLLEQVLELVRQGVPVAHAAEVVKGEQETDVSHRAGRLDASMPARVAARRLRMLRRAAEGLDGETVRLVVTESLREYGTVETWERLLVPVLAELGALAADPASGVDAEHVATGAIAAALHTPTGTGIDADESPILLACAPDEQHSLPLEALRRALAERRRRTAVLGARVPPDALLTAVRRTNAVAVVVWAHASELARQAPLHEIADLGVRVVAAGPGWWGVPVPPGTQRPSSLGEAVMVLT